MVLACRISIILSFVSMTRGNSFLSWDGVFWTAAGITDLPSPAAPRVKLVMTAPMSPIERKTPPSAAQRQRTKGDRKPNKKCQRRMQNQANNKLK